MNTAIVSSLPLLLLASMASAQTVPVMWDRSAEWIDLPAAAIGTTLGNPGPDSMGNLVWHYEWEKIGGGGPPMWAGSESRTPMVVDPSFWGGVAAFAHGQDCCAAVFDDSLLDVYGTVFAWKPKPFVRWENTTGQSFALDIVGTLTVGWLGEINNPVHPTDVDIGIVFLDASEGNAKTPLYVTHVAKPTPGSLLVMI